MFYLWYDNSLDIAIRLITAKQKNPNKYNK